MPWKRAPNCATGPLAFAGAGFILPVLRRFVNLATLRVRTTQYNHSMIAADANEIEEVEQWLRSAGLRHRSRSGSRAESVPRARHRRMEAPEPEARRRSRATDIRPLRSTLLTEHGVQHCFSTRTGGSSLVYRAPGKRAGELNLAFTKSDTKEAVLNNRNRLAERIFGVTQGFVTLRQLHSSLVHRVSRADVSEQAGRSGDGLMTDDPAAALAIQTADCVPVLVADCRLGAVAAFHAGWRGTLSRIVEKGIGRMRIEFGSRTEDLVAAIGPSIRQCCYSVGEEIEHAFIAQFAYADELFCEVYDTDPVRKKYPMLFLSQRAPGHTPMGPNLHLDLQEANKRQLLSAGLPLAAIDVIGECTACRTDLFFSYRGEHGFTGRMLSVIVAS